mmetsp:Transcript_8477/g.29000  ORF Transcript_8477/g.29000 Transcript_8477/m.29000 type:complete len:153 (-) Transcript_8477:252-710(-)
MAPADMRCREVEFSISLEQFLMVGTYNQVHDRRSFFSPDMESIQVLAAKTSMPAPEHFSYFMGMLLDTVRDTIAECAESAYESLDCISAREMMMFNSEQELNQFITRSHSGWSLVEGRIIFNTNSHPRSQEIPSRRLISENLIYATELERIV